MRISDWSSDVCSSDLLDVDGLQRGLRPFGGEFMGNGPARGLGDEAQALLPVEAVDLVDDAIDVEGQFGAGGFDGAIVGDQRFQRVDAGQAVGAGPAPACDGLHDAALGFGGDGADFAPAMREKAPRAASGEGGVLLGPGTGAAVGGT